MVWMGEGKEISTKRRLCVAFLRLKLFVALLLLEKVVVEGMEAGWEEVPKTVLRHPSHTVVYVRPVLRARDRAQTAVEGFPTDALRIHTAM